MQIPLAVSGLFSPLGCRPLAKAIHPSASASGLFPLWLRAPRFISAALSSHSALLSGARGGSCLGEGRSPSPSSVSSSFLRSPPFAQPPSSFSLVYVVVSLPLLYRPTSVRVGARPSPWTPSGNSPEANANACPECREDATLLPPVRACSACGGSLRSFYIQDTFTFLADLNYFPFLFERREVACGSCVRDMQKFLHFVVRDSILLRERFHDFVPFLALAVLD